MSRRAPRCIPYTAAQLDAMRSGLIMVTADRKSYFAHLLGPPFNDPAEEEHQGQWLTMHKHGVGFSWDYANGPYLTSSELAALGKLRPWRK